MEDKKMGRWEDGEMGRWGDGKIENCKFSSSALKNYSRKSFLYQKKKSKNKIN
jgi:hypothetical protein